MKKLLMGVVVAFAVVLSFGASEKPTTQNLSFILRPSQVSIAASEPFSLYAALINIGTEPVKVDYFWQTLSFHVAFDDGPFERWGLGSQAGKDVGGDRDLPVGGVLSSFESLFERPLASGEGLEFIFSRPGNYRVKARLLVGAQPVELWSPEVQVRVDPLPPSEEPAKTIVTDKMIARGIRSGMFPTGGVAQAETFLRQHPRSRWADYLHFALGTYYSGSYHEQPFGRLEASKRALQHFESVSAVHSPLKLEALREWSRTLIRGPAEAASADQVAQHLEELKKWSSLAKDVGLEKELEEARAALQVRVNR